MYGHGLLATEDGPWSSDTVSLSYQNARERSQLVLIQPTGNAWTNSYGWDADHRLSTLTSPAGTHTYTYNSQGSLVRKLALPGGRYITNTFDSLARVIDTSVMTNSSGTFFNRHGYAYNHAHQRTTISRTNSNATGWNGYSTITYDDAGEVRTVSGFDASGASVPADNFAYGYDAGWNMLKRTNNVTVSTYTPNVLNQASGSYDNNGNRTSGTETYTYDAENQLVSVEQASSWKLEYTYDGRQRLRIVKDYEYSGGSYTLRSETRYVYDGMLLLQERNSSGHPLVTYSRGRDLSGSFESAGGIGGLLARTAHATGSPYQPSTHAYYHADGNGNVTYLTRGDGSSVGGYKFDPFGRLVASTGTLASGNLMRFSSKLWVQSSSGSTGLYYYGYRFYDPTSQRWPNRDPIGEKGGLNLYGMVGNNPVNWIDGLGLSPQGSYPDWGGNPPQVPYRPSPSQGNCWRYACDDPAKPGEPHSPFPGGNDPGRRLTCKDVIDGAKKKGAVDPKGGSCPPCHRKIKAVLQSKGPASNPDFNDYHWYRQESDGSWSHKPGERSPIAGVTDPTQDGNNRGYDQDCGDLCVPDKMNVD